MPLGNCLIIKYLHIIKFDFYCVFLLITTQNNKIYYKMESINEFVYLKKSVTLYKICIGNLGFSILMSFILNPLLKDNWYSDVIRIFIGLPLLSFLVIPPIGLFYSWKSYKRKEGLSKTRFKYFMGHLIFCILIIVIIKMLMIDIAKLLE